MLPTSLHVGCLFTYHPGLAAEVVYGIQRVDSRKPSILKADDQAAVVFSQGHAVGMLSNQDEVRFEGPAKRGGNSCIITWQYNQGLLVIALTLRGCCQLRGQVGEAGNNSPLPSYKPDELKRTDIFLCWGFRLFPRFLFNLQQGETCPK